MKDGRRRPAVRPMIRVDQAGEYGATRIYAGQLAVLGEGGATARAIRGMAEQEAAHNEAFDRLTVERGVRPTLLQPFWNRAGHALGALTALMGPRAAMACTAAVESVIDRHYEEQRQALLATPAEERDGELLDMIERFQADEREHHDAAIAAGAESTPGYPLLSAIIRAGCRAAIAASKRL